MTRNSKGPQFRLEHLGIVVLVLTIFVLPILQSVTRDWFSPGWDVATYGILGVGIVALTFLPWLRARPLQKLLNERLSGNAEDFGVIVTLWGADSKPSELVALIANRDGLEFLTPHLPSQRIAWRDIVDIQEIYSAPGRPDMIKVVTAIDPEGVRFVPMSESGMYKLRVPLIADRVARLRAMRSR